MDNNQQRQQPTTTQVRTFYSEGIAYISTQFFNTNFSINIVPFASKDPTGKITYDRQGGVGTTINFEAAFTLFEALHGIYNGTKYAKGGIVNLPCTGGATLVLERKVGTTGQMETWLICSKNGKTSSFKFATIMTKEMVNGTMTDVISEAGVGAFGMTIHGYLTGINDGRHLDKLTEDYVKSLEPNAQQRPGGNFQTNSGYRPNNQYRNNNNRGNWNNNNRGNWNNNRNQTSAPPQQQSWENQQSQGTQNMSTYNLPQ